MAAAAPWGRGPRRNKGCLEGRLQQLDVEEPLRDWQVMPEQDRALMRLPRQDRLIVARAAATWAPLLLSPSSTCVQRG